mmetsp:Transcript_20665/g.19678  ORF Transcript_20665/g.19678 Transcript_20665/m.19678 type:complete len:107 (-) Transcript_20665:2481-2801(-)
MNEQKKVHLATATQNKRQQSVGVVQNPLNQQHHLLSNDHKHVLQGSFFINNGGKKGSESSSLERTGFQKHDSSNFNFVQHSASGKNYSSNFSGTAAFDSSKAGYPF